MNRRYSIGGGGKSSYSKGFSDFNYYDFVNFCHTIFKKTLAFTLAETLIVMGIIGVIAALTLPNLNSSTGEKEKVAKVKKFYSDFSDAFGRATAVYGPVDTWFQNDSDYAAKTARFATRLADFFKISKNCGTGTGCFTAGTKSFRGSSGNGTDYNSDTNYYKYILGDGMSVGFSYYADDPGSSDELSVNIIIDIDGPNNGANVSGKDFFYIPRIRKDGTLLSSSDLGLDGVIWDDVLYNCFRDGSECTGWIVYTGNMDYLKASSSGKCPNNTQLSETITSCK